MVVRGEIDFNVECPHYVLIEIGYKSIPIVGNGRFADTKPRSPFKEGFTTFMLELVRIFSGFGIYAEIAFTHNSALIMPFGKGALKTYYGFPYRTKYE